MKTKREDRTFRIINCKDCGVVVGRLEYLGGANWKLKLDTSVCSKVEAGVFGYRCDKCAGR